MDDTEMDDTERGDRVQRIISKPQLVIERRCALFIARPSLGFPPSDLPHGLMDLPRREVEPRPGFTVATCPRPEAQAPLTVNPRQLGR